MMISKLDREQFALLAFHVFFQHSTKPIVTVTSALAGDGKGYVGAGLARALAMSGRSTALVEIFSNSDTAMTTLQTYSITSSFDCVRLEDQIVADARETRRALREINARFDVLVLVLDDTFATSMNLELLSASSCTVISIAHGRKAQYEDLRLRDFLASLGKPIVGVVPTHKHAQRTPISSLTEAALLGTSSYPKPAMITGKLDEAKDETKTEANVSAFASLRTGT
jgi:predicted GTPase